MKKIAFICRHDSSIKMSAFLAKEFHRQGYLVKSFFIDHDSEQNRKLIEEYELPGEIEFRRDYLPFFQSDELFEFDVVHIMTVGSFIGDLYSSFCENIRSAPKKRPLLLTGLIGTLGGTVHHCYVQRQMADVFYVGGGFDQKRLQEVAKNFGDGPEKIVNTGLPIYDGVEAKPLELNSSGQFNEPQKILFAGQLVVPPLKRQRAWVVQSLIELANKYPKKEFVLKPRIKPQQDTIHKTDAHFENLLFEYKGKVPSNFRIDYTNIQKLIEEADLTLTVCSTAAIEAIVAGKNVGFVTDFGIKEDFGNHIFLPSGAARSFTEMLQGNWPQLNPQWAKDYVNLEGGASKAIFDEVEKALADKSANIQSGKFEPYYYMKSVYPGVKRGRKEASAVKEPPGMVMVPARIVKGGMMRSMRWMRKSKRMNKLITKVVEQFKDVYVKTG